jgi:transposase
MEIITGVERRRRWSCGEKLRIVAETEQSGGGIAETARRYEISRGLLWNWRSQVRRGLLTPEPASAFLPVQLIGEAAGAEPCRETISDPAVANDKIEITLPDGTSIRIGHGVSLVTLRRVVTALRG